MTISTRNPHGTVEEGRSDSERNIDLRTSRSNIDPEDKRSPGSVGSTQPGNLASVLHPLSREGIPNDVRASYSPGGLMGIAYIKIDNNLPEHPRYVVLSNRAFRELITAWCRCGRYFSDGWLAADEAEAIISRRTRPELLRWGHYQVIDGKYYFPNAPEARRESRGRKAIPLVLRLAVYERDGNQCLHCGTSQALTLDHIFPYVRGGKDTLENLQTLCQSCNSKKGVRV